ncbi:MAG: bifunctional 5,10-methylenetetrahydrofolate dehydrogenase/5,10-methenyltetrahydrofolate cyclohydrolase [Candidatus Omnitrophica bacterium]|nr:bifunctional 5,10-methylenetetrahydrofolate dehydrogenase/5,10-methenyltetrahydrofolate cyclohydrolase [Candidatus Omnitrophota bacterium]
MTLKTSQILNGKEIAAKHFDLVSRELQALEKKGVRLSLASVQVGEPKDAQLYSKAIEHLLKKLGVRYTAKVFPAQISQNELCKQILKLNADPEISALLLFSPLPAHLELIPVLNTIDLLKDVEGRRVLHGAGERVLSPTAVAVMALIEDTGCDLKGKEAVVVGRSDVVGKPCAILLLDKRVTVTVCHSSTKDLKAHIERADVVVATVGKPHLIKGEWIKPGAIVIDVGENVVNGKLVGDVEFETAKERAGFISPVPGGVGPVTNLMLVRNLITLHKLREATDGDR